MKNIHLLPINGKKASYLAFDRNRKLRFSEWSHPYASVGGWIALNAYITSDEEIREGDYWVYICPINGLDDGNNNNPIVKNHLPSTWFEKLHDKENYKKIILTTDEDLIKDGVQAIDDEFLEWFVKNPSCDEVEVDIDEREVGNHLRGVVTEYGDYKIIIPKEEPTIEEEYTSQDFLNEVCWNNSKQETLEEAAENYKLNTINAFGDYQSFIAGAKWQQEQIGKSEFLQRLRATKSDAEARRLIFEQFKNK